MIIHACIIVKFLRKEKSVSRLRETDKILISIKEILDLFASAGVTELSESLCLDLSDTLSGNIKLLAHLFKSTGTAVLKTESETEHLFLTLGKGGKHLAKLFLEQEEVLPWRLR